MVGINLIFHLDQLSMPITSNVIMDDNNDDEMN